MKMTLQECVQSKAFRWGVIIIGVLSVALVSFSAGLAVGLHKARFSYAWGENYEQNFLGRSRGMMEDKMMGKMEDGRGFRNPHGTMGTVLSVADDSLLLKNRRVTRNQMCVSPRRRSS